MLTRVNVYKIDTALDSAAYDSYIEASPYVEFHNSVIGQYLRNADIKYETETETIFDNPYARVIQTLFYVELTDEQLADWYEQVVIWKLTHPDIKIL